MLHARCGNAHCRPTMSGCQLKSMRTPISFRLFNSVNQSSIALIPSLTLTLPNVSLYIFSHAETILVPVFVFMCDNPSALLIQLAPRQIFEGLCCSAR